MPGEEIHARDLLGMKDVYRWYTNLERGSPATADLYLRRLAKFCHDERINPEQLLGMSDEELRDRIMDYLELLRNKSGSYQLSFVQAIKSWLRFGNRRLDIFLKIDTRAKVSETEKVPSKEELRKVLMVADLRTRAAMALIAFGGLRLEVLGDYRGSDGLRIGDLPELRVGAGVAFVNEPAMVVVRSKLSKARHQYFTFIGEEACEYVLDYLRYRLDKGERLDETSPLIASRTGGFLRTNSLGEMIRRAIRIAGFEWRPYVLRHYFDTYMLMAEAAGIIPEDYRVFWMGHKGDVEHQYTTNKNRLPETLVRDMRLKYGYAAETFLETKFREEPGKKEPGQKVVDPDEVEKWIESGWEYVATLPNNKVVLKKVQ